jgi:hypothetical protein
VTFAAAALRALAGDNSNGMDGEQQPSPAGGAVKVRRQVQDVVNKEKLERSQAMDAAIKRISLTQLELKVSCTNYPPY